MTKAQKEKFVWVNITHRKSHLVGGNNSNFYLNEKQKLNYKSNINGFPFPSIIIT